MWRKRLNVIGWASHLNLRLFYAISIFFRDEMWRPGPAWPKLLLSPYVVFHLASFLYIVTLINYKKKSIFYLNSKRMCCTLDRVSSLVLQVTWSLSFLTRKAVGTISPHWKLSKFATESMQWTWVPIYQFHIFL